MTQKVGGIEFEVDVDVNGVKGASSEVQSDLRNVESSFRKVDAAADATGKSMVSASSKGAKGMRQLRGAAGNVGFQLQDMAVQAQMGTSALTILGQQGSQIAGAFGPGGAIVGAVIAVGSALAALAFNTEETSDSTEELTEKLKELSKTNELTLAQQKFLKQQQEEENRTKQEKIKALKEEKKELLENAETGSWYQKMILGASAANQGFVSFVASKMIPTLTDEQKELIKVNAELDTLAGKTGAVKFDPEENKKAIMSYRDRIAGIGAALDQESSLVINNLKYRAAAENGIMSEQVAAAKLLQENKIVNEKAAFESRMQVLNEQRESILENEALTEGQRAELLSQFRVMQTQAEYTHQQKLTDIEEQASEKRKQIAEQEQRQKLAGLSSMFGNLSSLMNSESRKMFEIGKAAAIAGAIVDGIAAVQGSYKWGEKIGGPPLGAAFAAAAAANALMNVQQIRNTKFGSAGTGQSMQGGQVVNNTATQQQPQQNVSINLAGSANYTAGDIRGLIDAINDQTGDGYQLNVTGG